MLVTNLTHANGNDYLSQRFSKAYAFLAQGRPGCSAARP